MPKEVAPTRTPENFAVRITSWVKTEFSTPSSRELLTLTAVVGAVIGYQLFWMKAPIFPRRQKKSRDHKLQEISLVDITIGLLI